MAEGLNTFFKVNLAFYKVKVKRKSALWHFSNYLLFV